MCTQHLSFSTICEQLVTRNETLQGDIDGAKEDESANSSSSSSNSSSDSESQSSGFGFSKGKPGPKKKARKSSGSASGRGRATGGRGAMRTPRQEKFPRVTSDSCYHLDV
jgi:hypothetical protein